MELGERLIELLEDGELRQTLRARARDVSAQWHGDQVTERLGGFFSRHGRL